MRCFAERWMSCISGHAYYFLEDVYPRMTGRRPLRTPGFVKALFSEAPEVGGCFYGMEDVCSHPVLFQPTSAGQWPARCSVETLLDGGAFNLHGRSSHSQPSMPMPWCRTVQPKQVIPELLDPSAACSIPEMELCDCRCSHRIVAYAGEER